MADLERKSWTGAIASALQSKNFWIGATASMVGGFMGAGVLYLIDKYKKKSSVTATAQSFRSNFMRQALMTRPQSYTGIRSSYSAYPMRMQVASGECSGSQFSDSDVCVD